MAPPREIVRALVYRYVYWDEATRSHKTSTLYATLPAIRNGLGSPVYEGAIYVDSDHLDGGIYVPPSPTHPAVVKEAGDAQH
jgi:hypothetical protein